MDRFLVISPHTEKDCRDVLRLTLAAGYLTHFDWGCLDGVHTGWAIVEADNAQEAMLSVPTGQRHLASVVEITKFTPEQINKMHQPPASSGRVRDPGDDR